MIRVALLTDNDCGKVNGLTATLRAVVAHAPSDVRLRIYTAAQVAVADPVSLATASARPGLPRYRDMRAYWPRPARLLRQLRADRVDVIHITTPGPVGLAARWLARSLEVPLTGSYHTHVGACTSSLSGSPRVGQLLERYARWLYSACDPLLVPSTATCDDLLQSGYRASRLRLWTPGVDSRLFNVSRVSEDLRARWQADESRPAILYAGRLSRDKGLDLLPAIGGLLAAQGIGHRFVFIGDGPLREELRARCPDAVFMGAITQAEVAVAMASADLFLFPSATDCMANVVLEAQASGLPVVVSSRGGPREHMVAGATGRVAAAGDATSFAREIAFLLGSADQRRRMGRSARAFAITRTWSDACRPLFGAWHSAVARHAPGPFGQGSRSNSYSQQQDRLASLAARPGAQA